MVPLGPDELLWVGWMLEGEITVGGADADNRTVRLIEVAKSSGWRLLTAEWVETNDGPHPINGTFYPPAAEPDRLDRPHLIFEIVGDDAGKTEQLAILLGTGALYASLSGLPPPAATSLSDAYGGWRLP
jgi:hypothetical protein